MQSTVAPLPWPLRWPARLIDVLCDPKHANSAIVAVLVCYVALWTLYAVISKSSQGIHPDMAEVAAWSGWLEWGTPKHPPLLPALVRVWFSILPAADWSFYLLSVTLIAVAIYFSWLLAGLFLDGIKRAMVPFFLMLIPFYNFLGLRLDHNVILIPLWAATTFCFLKAYWTRAISWSIAAGICAAMAVLAKYWSFLLLLGLGIGALTGANRKAFFASAAPGVIAATSFFLFLPHIIWLQGSGYPTFKWASHRQALDAWELVQGLWSYGVSTLGYIGVPIVVLALLEPTFRRELKTTIVPREAPMRFVAVLFWTPLVASVIVTLVSNMRLGAVWTMSALSMLGILVLMSPRVSISRQTAATMAAAATMLGFGALLASPIVAWTKVVNGVENEALYTRELARRVEDHFDRLKRKKPLYLAGRYAVSHAVAFYMQDRPLPLSILPRVPALWSARLDPDEVTSLCLASDEECRRNARIHPLGQWVTIEIEPSWLGQRGEKRTFVLEQKPPLGDDNGYCCISTSPKPNSGR